MIRCIHNYVFRDQYIRLFIYLSLREVIAILHENDWIKREQSSRGMFIWNDFRAESKLEPNQWDTALLCNDVCYWLSASLESALWLERDFTSASLIAFDNKIIILYPSNNVWVPVYTLGTLAATAPQDGQLVESDYLDMKYYIKITASYVARGFSNFRDKHHRPATEPQNTIRRPSLSGVIAALSPKSAVIWNQLFANLKHAIKVFVFTVCTGSCCLMWFVWRCGHIQ